jgi:translocation and assembly module TamB
MALLKFLGRAVKWLFYSLVAIVAVLAILLLFVGLVPAGSAMFSDIVAARLSTNDHKIAFGPMSGLFGGHLKIASIELADAKGPYAKASDIALDWSPLALLSGAFEAESLTIGAVALDRRPDLPARPADTQAASLSLPLAIHVERIAVADLGISAELAGQSFSLTLDGRLAADNSAVDLDLAVRDEARPGAGVTAHLVFNPGKNLLDVEAALREPKGGLVARLARLRGSPAVDVAIKGNAPLSDWKGHVTAALDGKPVLSLDALHQLQATDGRRISLGGKAAIEDVLPAGLSAYFAGETDVDIDVLLSADGALRISKGQITSQSLTLVAQGGFDPDGMSDIKASLRPRGEMLETIVPSGGVDARAVITSADVALFGPADSLDMTADAALASLTSPQFNLTGIRLGLVSSGFNIKTRSGAVEAELSIETSRFADANVDRLIAAPLKLKLPLDVSPDQISTAGASLESASVGGTVAGKYELAAGAFTADVRLFALGAILPEALAEKVQGKISMAGHVAGHFPADLSVSDFSIESDLVNLAGKFDIKEGNMSGAVDGKVVDIAPFAPDVSGALDFSLRAKGPIDGPSVEAKISTANATLAGRPVRDLSILLDGVASLQNPSGSVKASGKIDDQTIEADATVTSEQGKVSLPLLAVRIGDNRLDGAFEFSPAFRPKGAVRFDLPDLGLMAALVGQKAEGSLSGKAMLDEKDGKMTLALLAKGKGIVQGDFRLVAPDIDIHTDDLVSGKIEGRLKVKEIASGANIASDIDLAFRPAGEQTGFDLTGQYDGGPLSAKGMVGRNADGFDLALSSFSASPRKIPVRLASPATFSIADGAATFKNLEITAGKGRVTASGLAGTTLAIDIGLADLPMNLANAFSPGLGAEGAISGQLRISGDAAAPSVAFDLKLAGANVAAAREAGIGATRVAAKGQLSSNTLTLNVDAVNAAGLSVKGGGTLSLAGVKAMKMKFAGRLPLAALDEVMAVQGFKLTGGAEFDVDIAGNLPLPAINGQVNTKNARLVDVRRNFAINDIQAAIKMNGSRATIERFEGKLSTGGGISAKGDVGLLPGSGYPARIAIELGNATYVQGELANANLNGSLKLDGPLLTAPTLSGKIRITKAGISIPEKMPASLAAIDVKHKHSSAAVNAQAEKIRPKGMRSQSGSRFAFNLEISAPSQIFIRGRGLDAEMGGTLTLGGDLENPVVSGGFKMKRGRLSILGKRLDFTSGTVSFGGGLVPVLNLVASSVVNATTVNVTVSGTADDPIVAFTASPALPEDEVLSLLIFSRSKASLSVFQIAQLADAAAQLAGGRKSSLFESLRKGLGVDDLDVTTDEEGNSSVKAGKYLNNRTYLEVQQGKDPGTGKAVINLDIGKGVKLQGGASSDGTGSAGIVYEKEY